MRQAIIMYFDVGCWTINILISAETSDKIIWQAIIMYFDGKVIHY